MHLDSHKNALYMRHFGFDSLKKVLKIITCGIDLKQWFACVTIYTLIGPLFLMPIGTYASPLKNPNNATLESVNEDISSLTRVWRHFNADLDAKLTPWRRANLNLDLGGPRVDDDKNLKKAEPKLDNPTADSDGAMTHRNVSNDPVSNENIHVDSEPNNLLTTAAPLFQQSQIPDGEYDSLFSYENNLGFPKGQVERDSSNTASALPIRHRVGIANFNFGLPLASISGRGIDAGIGLTYNSRTWNKSCSGNLCSTDHYIYDVEQSWIAPGFSSGLGYLETSAVNVNVITNPPNNDWHTEIRPGGLTDPDGTRHQLECVAWTAISGTPGPQMRCTKYGTSDGTNIKIDAKAYIDNPGNSPSPNLSTYPGASFSTRLPDGTFVYYSGGFGSSTDTRRRHYPLVIQDRNGNRIRIAYRSDQSGRIDYITDTLNRQIKFYYENDTYGNPEKLVAITIPGTGTTGELQVARFYYDSISLSTSGKFDGDITAPTSILALTHVYFPATKTQYKYEYDTNYGMIKKISRFVGATASSTSLSSTG